MTAFPRIPARAAARAFTLVETIAALVVIGTIGSVSSGLIYSAVDSYRTASTTAQLHSDCSGALDRLSKALWSIPRDSTASVVAPQISSVTATSIAWSGNWSLSLSGTQLLLTEPGGTAQPIHENVTSFSLACFDENNSALAANLSGSATQAIRRIQVNVTVSRQGVTQSLRTRAFIRSTMSGAAIG